MHTFLGRANTVFAFTLSTLSVLTFLCFLTTAFSEHKSGVTISTAKHMVKNVPEYSASREKNDLGFVTFDLKADLNNLFNWNVKQLFLYLTAEYQTANNAINQVVLWDKILLRGDNARLDLQNMNIKYYFWDDGNGLKGHDNITLTLSWNVIPNAGQLPRIPGSGSHQFSFPNEYHSHKQ